MIYSTIYYITTSFFEFFMALNLFHIHFNLDAVRLWSNILPSLEWVFPWTRFPLIKSFHPYPTMVKPGTVLYYLKRKIKKIKITWYTPWVLLRSVFLLQKLSTFAISRDRDKDCTVTSNFDFLLLFLNLGGCFNKLGFNFDVIKVDDFRNLHKIWVFWRLWQHNFCSWHHQQSFITWQTIMKMWSCD